MLFLICLHLALTNFFQAVDDKSRESVEQLITVLQQQVRALVERIGSKSSIDKFLFIYFDEIHLLIPANTEMDDKN